MNWKTKALIQTAIARLPGPLSRRCYYAMQLSTGSFRAPKADFYANAALKLRDHIERHGGSVAGASFLEVGTGRRLTLPIFLWLLGAGKVVTVDLNPYLKKFVVALDLEAIVRAREDLIARSGGRNRFLPERMQALAELMARPWSLADLLQLCSIRYQAPADATRLDLPAAVFDYHVSFTVFEHIPRVVLIGILAEARRLLRPSGLAVHLVDHTDHFSHSDASISAINFLQFEDAAWAPLADNRYMYMNRLREDDYPAIYEEAGHDIREMDTTRDESLRALLASPGFKLASQFAKKDPESLIAMTSWFVSSPKGRI